MKKNVLSMAFVFVSVSLVIAILFMAGTPVSVYADNQADSSTAKVKNDLPKGFRELKQKEYSALKNPEIDFAAYYESEVKEYRRLQALKKDPTLQYIPGQPLNSMCGNGDFEDGLLQTEWNGGYGMVDDNTCLVDYAHFTDVLLEGPIDNFDAHQTLVLAGMDPLNVPISTVAPGSSTQAVRIGNAVNGNGAELLSKSFIVTQNNAVISFWYALVLQDPGHPKNAQPSFRVRILDNNNTEIPGLVNLGNGSDEAIADSNNPFFQKIAAGQRALVYRDWSCAQIDLSKHVGKSVTVQFVTKDCCWGGHYGYAYVDNFCGSCGDSITFNGEKSSNCGKGKICFNYTLPIAGTMTGTISIALNIYQDGLLCATINSPVLTSGNMHCIDIDPATIAGINTGQTGFDFTATGSFSINGVSLAPVIVGIPPNGQVAGQNNDYFIDCFPGCCDSLTEKNLIQNPGFELGNTSFYSQYSYEPTVATNSVNVGEYGILTSAEALTVSSTWNPNCLSNGKHFVVNGATGQTGSRILWRQSVQVISKKGKYYKFCADFKNLPQCSFDVKPKISVTFSVPGFNLNNVVINAGSTGCTWQRVSKTIYVPAGAVPLDIAILLDETGIGDGNDLAIDNLALIPIPQTPLSEVLFNVNFSNVTVAAFNVTACPVAPLPKDCDAEWEVSEVDTNHNSIPNTTVIYPVPPDCTNFPGYNGTNMPSGSNPGVFNITKKYRIVYKRICDCKTRNVYAIILEPNPSGMALDSKTKSLGSQTKKINYYVDEEYMKKMSL